MQQTEGHNPTSHYEQNRIDVAEMVQPFITEVQLLNQSGSMAGQFRIIGDDYNYGTRGSLITGYVATPQWANSNQQIVKEYIAGLTMAVNAIRANSSLARQYFINTLKINSTAAAAMPMLNYTYGPIPYLFIQGQINLSIKVGILTNPTDDATSIVNPNFMQLTST